jgi:hypothetical protein
MKLYLQQSENYNMQIRRVVIILWLPSNRASEEKGKAGYHHDLKPETNFKVSNNNANNLKSKFNLWISQRHSQQLSFQSFGTIISQLDNIC